MKTLIILAFLLLAILIGDTASGDSDKRAAWKAGQAKLNHIHRSRPRRLDVPLRTENISDEEVREIQAITDRVYPGAIANISGVTEGCPCEEGPQCTSQVWVVAYRKSRYKGLMLSRVDGKWTVGRIQDWWIKYENLRSRYREALTDRTVDRREAYKRLRDEQLKLLEKFPICY